MERYEIGGGERLVAMVEAAARGEKAVSTRGGKVVATIRTTGAARLPDAIHIVRPR